MHNSPHMLLASDPEKIKGATLSNGLVRRVVDFARPYRLLLVGYLLIIVLEALLALVPVLLFKQIVDIISVPDIPDGTSTRVTSLALLIVAAAVATAALSFVDRWWSSRIGEGLIYDLRVALFDHVQRHADRVLHPHPDRRADQPHEQRRDRRAAGGHRHARHGRLQRRHARHHARSPCSSSSGGSPLLALVLLPLFIIPAKRVGPAAAGDHPRGHGPQRRR